jgi:hypothetical protein
MDSDALPLTPEDRRMLERLAGRIAELRLETPALLAIESARPLSLVAGQALVFFQPFVQALFPVPHLERFARLIERRENIETLARMIEDAADRRSAGPGRPLTPS